MWLVRLLNVFGFRGSRLDYVYTWGKKLHYMVKAKTGMSEKRQTSIFEGDTNSLSDLGRFCQASSPPKTSSTFFFSNLEDFASCSQGKMNIINGQFK